MDTPPRTFDGYLVELGTVLPCVVTVNVCRGPQLDSNPWKCQWFGIFALLELLSGGLKCLVKWLFEFTISKNHESKEKRVNEHSLFRSFQLSPSGPHCSVDEAGLFKAIALPFGSGGGRTCAGGPLFDSKLPWHQNKQTLHTAANTPVNWWAQGGICNYSN